MKPVKIYTTNYCPFCQRAKAFLTEKKVPFEEVRVDADEDFDALVEKTGWKTVPQIFIGEEMIGGFDALAALEQSGELNKKLL
ncbi:MAG: glutaredoxin 3 [bacterium]|nr:glutaredoxin 3 [bacterium]